MTTSTVVEPCPTRTEAAFVDSLPAKNIAPLWTQMHTMVSNRPNPRAATAVWKYEEIRPLLIKAGELLSAEKAERRALMLVNPQLEAPHTTDTIYGGFQLILPGETAPAHRHIAFALRFIIEGENGFTAVEGQKMIMRRGDVILTPSWHWHDHGNEGKNPVIWLDGLDLPLLKYAPVNFAETYMDLRFASELSGESPWRFPWKDVEADLDSQAGQHRTYHYHHSGQQRHLSNTISAQAEMILPASTSAVSRDTCSFIYHCYEGEGHTIVKTPSGEQTKIEWTPKDTFAIPAWSEVRHVNTGRQSAYLFAINDRPLIESLGLGREERRLANLA